MSKLDWKNIDFGNLAKSQVAIGSAVAILASLAAIAGFTLSPDDQSQLSNIITSGLTLAGAVYALWHRVVAQPEHQTVIVPTKDSTNPPSQKAG
jgi:hypothetical protein